MSKLCSVCGTENREEAQFCRACGTAFVGRQGGGRRRRHCRQRLRRVRLPEQAGHPLLRQLRHEPRGRRRGRGRRRSDAIGRRRVRGRLTAADFVSLVRDGVALPDGARYRPLVALRPAAHPRHPRSRRGDRAAPAGGLRIARRHHGDVPESARAESRAADPRHRPRRPRPCRRRGLALHGQLEPGAPGRCARADERDAAGRGDADAGADDARRRSSSRKRRRRTRRRRRRAPRASDTTAPPPPTAAAPLGTPPAAAAPLPQLGDPAVESADAEAKRVAAEKRKEKAAKDKAERDAKAKAATDQGTADRRPARRAGRAGEAPRRGRAARRGRAPRRRRPRRPLRSCRRAA